jgi:hypothetical protein
MTQTNRIDKVHVSQQSLSASSIITYTGMSLARLEVIQVFHKSRNFGFHFSAQLPTDGCGPGIRMYVKVHRKKRVRGIVEVCFPACLRINQDRVLHRCLKRDSIDLGY